MVQLSLGFPRERDRPALTTLSFSGGRQSTWLLESVLRGDIPRPDPFLVVTADPGAEKQETYKRVAEYKSRCEQSGIAFVVAPGPKIDRDTIDIQNGHKSRIDNPPLWTRRSSTDIEYPEPHPTQGEVFALYCDAMDHPEKYRPTRDALRAKGQLKQCCTAYYKIAPIRRAIRSHLAQLRGDRRVWSGCVETWIGFGSHEKHRANKAQQDVQWQTLRFPMIEMDIDPNRVHDDWNRWGLPEPVISMCNCCPFHGLRSLQDMHENRNQDWMQAVYLDRRLRDFPNAGVANQCFVSQSLIPLEVMPLIGFTSGDELEDETHLQCDSGLCFM